VESWTIQRNCRADGSVSFVLFFVFSIWVGIKWGPLGRGGGGATSHRLSGDEPTHLGCYDNRRCESLINGVVERRCRRAVSRRGVLIIDRNTAPSTPFSQEASRQYFHWKRRRAQKKLASENWIGYLRTADEKRRKIKTKKNKSGLTIATIESGRDCQAGAIERPTGVDNKSARLESTAELSTLGFVKSDVIRKVSRSRSVPTATWVDLIRNFRDRWLPFYGFFSSED